MYLWMWLEVCPALSVYFDEQKMTGLPNLYHKLKNILFKKISNQVKHSKILKNGTNETRCVRALSSNKNWDV